MPNQRACVQWLLLCIVLHHSACGSGELISAGAAVQPTISAVLPASVATAGGQVVRVLGRDFAAQPRVYFAGTEAMQVRRDSGEQLSVLVPSRLGQPGSAAVQVDNGGGLMATREDLFHYAATELRFQSPRGTAALAGSFALVSADFDLDGRQDLAVAGYAAPTEETTALQLLLGLGDGTFRAQAPIPSPGTTSLLAIDANADGNPDLVALRRTGSLVDASLDIFLGTGDGSFRDPVETAVSPDSAAIAAGFFNADRFPDLAVVDKQAGRVQIWYGSLSAALTRGPARATGAGPVAVATAQLDGDSYDDLVVANAGDASLSIFTNDKDTGFAAPKVVRVSLRPSRVLVADLNRDSVSDLFVLGSESTSAERFLGDGRGSVLPGSKLELVGSPVAAAIDSQPGKPTELTLGFHYLHPYRVSESAELEPLAPVWAGEVPIAIAYADFNNDGLPDIVSSRKHPTKRKKDSTLISFLADGKGGYYGSSRYELPLYPSAVALEDFDDDAHLDILLAGTAGAREQQGKLALFGLARKIANTGLVYKQRELLDIGNQSPHSLLVRRSAETGRLTAFVGPKYGQVLSVVSQDSLGVLQPLKDYRVGLLPRTLHGGDFNRDGRPDLVIAGWSMGIAVLLADTSGGYSPPLVLEQGTRDISSGEVADFDHNGTTDLLFLDADTKCVLWFSGRGDGTFSSPVCTSLHERYAPLYIAVADFDGDTHLDFAYHVRQSRSIALYVGDGRGEFTRSGPEAGSLPEEPVAVLAGDASGDGLPDLLAVQAGSLAIAVSGGRAGFSPALVLPTLPAFSTGGAKSPQIVAIGDLDRDGRADLVVANPDGATFSLVLNESL